MWTNFLHWNIFFLAYHSPFLFANLESSTPLLSPQSHSSSRVAAEVTMSPHHLSWWKSTSYPHSCHRHTSHRRASGYTKMATSAHDAYALRRRGRSGISREWSGVLAYVWAVWSPPLPWAWEYRVCSGVLLSSQRHGTWHRWSSSHRAWSFYYSGQ